MRDPSRWNSTGFVFNGLATHAAGHDRCQLRFAQPAVLTRELDGLSPWTQYNPHGVFIALEDAGYVLMGVAFAFTAFPPRARRPSRSETAVEQLS